MASGPSAEPRLVRVAAMVADATRSRMLCHLLSGEFASAGELARAAGVSAATASAHLAGLVDAGLLEREPRGRHRYYRLAGAEVAHALEALALVAERGSHERAGPPQGRMPECGAREDSIDRAWASPARQRLRAARCCYGHLAGQLGVALYERALDQGWFEPSANGLLLTERGADGLDAWGLDGAAWRARLTAPSRVRWARACPDWSERRDHLAGRLADAWLAHFIERGWLRRRAGERALDLTPAGRRVFGELAPTRLVTTPAGP